MRQLLAIAALAMIFFDGTENTVLAMDRVHFIELNKKGRELAKKKDWQGLREVLTEIGKELPAPTPNYLLRVASVEAHLGHQAEALRWLERYAAMGLTYDVASDGDLKPLLSDPAWPALATRLKQNASTVSRTEQVCTLPISDLMPEDITFNPASGDFFVSSIRRHSLFRLSLPRSGGTECGLQELPLDAQAKQWPVMAVSADPDGKTLWMTAAAMAGFKGLAKEDEGKTAVFSIDAGTGKTLHRFNLEHDGPAVLGDMSVSRSGVVFVTDSRGGGVYRIDGKWHDPELKRVAEGFFSPQTPVPARDRRRLFVPDYSVGIAVVHLKSTGKNKVTYLTHPDDVVVTGLDGLLLVGDSLIGIQNGTEPERVIRFHLNRRQTHIVRAEVVEQSSQRMGEPTHAVAAGGWVYVIANVGWNQVDDHGELKEGHTFSPPVLLRFRQH
jgi:hypothetical protein